MPTLPSFKDQVRSAPRQHNNPQQERSGRLPDFKDQVRSAAPSDPPPASAKRTKKNKHSGGPDFKDQARPAADDGSGPTPSTNQHRHRRPLTLHQSEEEEEQPPPAPLVSAFVVNSTVLRADEEPRSAIGEAVPVKMIRRRICVGLALFGVLVLVAGATTAVVLTRNSNSSNNNNNNNSGSSSTSDPALPPAASNTTTTTAPTIPTAPPTLAPSFPPTASSPTTAPTAHPSTSPPTMGPAVFEPLGQELEGSGNNDQFGTSVALSASGTVLAVGSIGAEGRVRVFDRVDDGDLSWWDERPSLPGLADGDEFGRSVDLSGDGSVLVAGAPLRDDNGGTTDAGSVRVFTYQAGAWVPTGLEILGPQAAAQSGYSVGISETGDTIAIGAPFWVSSDDHSGMVRVYRNVNNVWTQVGDDIVDEPSAYGDTGWSVSLSSNGETLAVGSHRHESPFDETGLVRVYELLGNNWQQLGQDLSGQGQRHDVYGNSVSLSSDGTTVAGGASAGYVAVYRLIGSSWEQLGDFLVGSIVSLSSDGNLLAVSSETAGKVQVYLYRSALNEWEQVGGDIVQEVSGGRFGASLDLERQDDGKVTIAVGSPFEFNGNLLADLEGSVRVYELEESEA